MPAIVIFLDLDDTILQTAPKCPAHERVYPAATNRAGQALSFMTSGQRQLLDCWQAQGTVIPVTGRTDDALARVLIDFNSWRITHHGAVIRQPDGQLPSWWRERVAPRLQAAQPLLGELAEWLERDAATGGYRVHRHRVEQQLTYLSVKSDEDAAVLVHLRRRLAAKGLPAELVLHHNGNNLALTVGGAQKQDAVRWVMATLAQEGPLLTIGAGDSLTDLPFLRLCDFALVPKDSQIQQETWAGHCP